MAFMPRSGRVRSPEAEALVEWSHRVERLDPDWRIYWPGETRRTMPWWRRLLKL